MKNINPPPTLPVLPIDEVTYAQSGITGMYNSTMVDTAVQKWLTALGFNFNVKRPVILFSDDDRWRAIIKVLAFNHRHTRDAVRKVMELLIHPMISQATVLNREYVRHINIGNLLDVQVALAPNVAGSPYTLTGVTPHELIFPNGTFAAVPDPGPITYEVGLGPIPIVGPTIGTTGRIYLANDGTERLLDPNVSFLNIHREDLLTALNKIFPQFGEVIFDKNSPVEEIKHMAFYGQLQSGLMKLKVGTQLDLSFTHAKYRPIRSSILTAPVEAGGPVLDVLNGANFPANLGPIDALAVNDQVAILDGVNAGTYTISAIEPHRIEINTGGAPLTVTGKNANNHFKITPNVPPVLPLGAKGTIFGTGGVVSVTAGPAPFFAVFRDDNVTFDVQIDPNLTTSTGYAVRINRGELTEEVVEVQSLTLNQLTLQSNPADLTGLTSLLAFSHQTEELVEIEDLSYSANSTYFTTSIITASDLVAPFSTVTDAAAAFLDTLVGSLVPPLVPFTADVEFITGPNEGLRRTILSLGGPAPATVVNVDPFPNQILIGNEYRIIKRYAVANNDGVLYLDDTSGLPAANFTVIIDRGTEQEEVLYISTNDITVTPNTLTISNSDAGTAFCAKDHSSSFAVEAAQVLMLGCDWDIIETRATGEYTIAASGVCVPQIDLNSFFLHDNVDLTKIGVAAAHPAAAIAAGDTEFTINLTGANSFASALENVGDRDGILNRALQVADGASTEEVFATRQKNFTSIGHYDALLDIYREFIPVGTTVLPVKDASQFEGLGTGLVSIEIDRNNPDPLIPETRVIALGGVDLANNNITITVATGQVHNLGASIELTVPTILITDVFANAFPVFGATNITLLYLGTTYRLESPYNPGTFTDVPQGNLIEAAPNPSYLPVVNNSVPPQPKKSIFPGSYVYSLPSIHYPINDQPSSYITTLATTHSGSDPTAIYKIPLAQEIIGSRLAADPFVVVGQDVGPGTIEILVADGLLFPEPIQNPFYVVLDHQRVQEELVNCVGKVANPVAGYPNAFVLQVDPLDVIDFAHYSRKFTVPQVSPISTVDLQVSKLRVANTSGFGDDGGIFIDYGFTDNQKLLCPIIIEGTVTGAPAPNEIEDNTKTFQQYYAAGTYPFSFDPNALVGAIVILRPGTPTQDIQEITTISSNILLHFFLAPFAPPPVALDPYRIYGLIEVDNSEFGTNLTHVGGVINNAGGTTVWHPAREGGITQEYVKFSSKDAATNILTLVQPTVFQKAHPAGTQVIIGTGTVGPKTDGSSYQPFLYTDFLTALFHKDVGNFGSIIKAAGIEIKAEDTDA